MVIGEDVRDRPLVSVIVPFFNAERFLAEAADSVVAQTYDRWELILVDDGSSDAGAAIAAEYASADPGRVRVVTHADRGNHGSSATRNHGIAASRGAYLAFLDSDDVWYPHKLREQVDVLERHDEVAGVYGRTQYWNTWAGDGAEREDYVPDLGIEPETIVLPPSLLTLSLLSRIRVASMSNIVLRREAVDAVEGFENPFRGMFDDQVFLAKISLMFPLFVAAACWDRYRQHPDSFVSIARARGEKYAAGIRYLEWLARYLRQQEVDDPDLWRALRRKRRRYRHPRLDGVLRRLSEPAARSYAP
jgi:glycosyltransferase involved in cell wall biosynthesis